jgi:hypothetical protein
VQRWQGAPTANNAAGFDDHEPKRPTHSTALARGLRQIVQADSANHST